MDSHRDRCPPGPRGASGACERLKVEVPESRFPSGELLTRAKARARGNGSAVQQVPRPVCAELGGRSVPLCQQRCESTGVYRQAHLI